ncbi:MAG: type IV toxin-antitoxin system AbiEi family antitoxin [Bacillota bacterium]|nr:type IV toxin-antitoxin system AbiEi family antitoxin [Bacillota bacterium]MDW7676597.1 type IV toxin-antitoxin system AbiEi family antitoxin [Bacillota bacterium]
MDTLTGYNELAQLVVFSPAEVAKLTGNRKTAYSLLDRLMKKGLVKKIRQNVYSCVNPATGQVIASRYQIACAVNDSAYLSHHTAFEYHGVAHQVFYDMYVSSKTKFRSFEFDGIRYRYVASKVDAGVVEPKHSEKVRVTDLERTVIDSIKDFEKIAGFEELLQCLDRVPYLDEDKLKRYLAVYEMQVLYQKTGFLLAHYRQQMQLSAAFFDHCKSRIGKSTRYLLRDRVGGSHYNGEWQLVVSEGVFDLTDQGRDENG